MSSESERTVPKEERKSRTPCIVLPIVGIFVLMLCYVTFVVVRNVSPTAIKETEGRRATATTQISNEIDAGATIAVELQAEATETARAMLSATPPGPTAETQTPTTTPGPRSHRPPQQRTSLRRLDNQGMKSEVQLNREP